MSVFDNIIGKKILNIQRLDSEVDYEHYSPYAIILTLANQNEKLIVSAINDGSSVDIRMTSDDQIENDYGLEFGELFFNELKENDELNSFIGNKLKELKIAEYISPSIKGTDFIIKQGKYAGIELKTETHKLLFQNQYGGWCTIDEEKVELTNKHRWRWI